MRMKRIFAAVLFVSIWWGIGALEVDREELRLDPSVRIQFQSNEGVPAKVETREQIRGIGLALGREAPGIRRYFDKYRAIRAVDPSVTTGFDADIIILEKTAGVDHIRNLRLIISGFITGVHGYSEKDSNLLAEYITIYNAVYRGKLDYFKEKYKPVVLSHLEPEKAGLAISYKEWPGLTQMVIPLSDPALSGPLGAVDTGVITDAKVVEELQTRDDKGVEIRKEMVDLKERQIEQEEKLVREEKKVLQEERTKLVEEEKRVREELSKVDADKKAAAPKEVVKSETPKTEAEKPGTPPVSAAVPAPASGETEKQAPAEEKPAQIAALEKKEEELKQAQAKIEEQKAAVEKKEEAVAAREEKIEEKKEEVRRDRTEIAKDQQQVLDKETAGMVSGIPFIKAEPGVGSVLGRLVLINPRTGEVLTVSPEPPVAVRNYEVFGGGLAVIQSRGGSGRLVILDRASLKEKIAAREEVFPLSIFRVMNGQLFAVIKDSGVWYVGKYDEALALLARSKIEVNPATFILFADTVLFVESAEGKIVPLGLAGME
jgi:hypothetical protein